MSSYVLAIDEGGTGVRAYVFDDRGRECAQAYLEIGLSCPRPGWVEHDALALWDQTLTVTRAALATADVDPRAIAGIGITNQRASAVVWDADSGLPLYPAIAWQDLRTVERCAELNRRMAVVNPPSPWRPIRLVVETASASVMPTTRFGTIDTWIAWRLSHGATYVTDASNASCTGLYDFFANRWDETLIEMLGLPVESFPSLVDTSAVAGVTAPDVLGASIPLAARAGDQQSAMFGQLRLQPGMTKITYGTSAMMDLNVGPSIRLSPHGAFPLVLWCLNGEVTYCLEGTAVTAGASVQWLRDGLGIIADAAESERLATSIADSGGVWCVPAFQGLGTPYLDSNVRAVLGGLSRGTGRAEIARAVLEGIAWRCREVLEALWVDAPESDRSVLRVDGGAARNDFLMQCQADVTGVVVERPQTLDAASLGAAYLAGLATGVWGHTSELERLWRLDRVFEPRMSEDERASGFARWKAIVALARQAP